MVGRNSGPNERHHPVVLVLGDVADGVDCLLASGDTIDRNTQQHRFPGSEGCLELLAEPFAMCSREVTVCER